MSKTIKFRDLKVGDKFECYGDTCINYDYPKICLCIKRSEDSAQELDESWSDGLGVNFFMSPGDEVFSYEEESKNESQKLFDNLLLTKECDNDWKTKAIKNYNNQELISSKIIKEAIDKGYTIIHKDSLLNNKTENSMNTYDSKSDTLLHIKRVNQLLTEASCELIRRANVHDDSKLESPEKELFDEFTPKLKASVYGSDEYKEMLKGLKVALDHHYKMNSHHPEHYENGINGFDLFDLIEMFFDWKAATERHDNGDIGDSIRINKDRFKMSDQLVDIFTNTAKRLGYIKHESKNL